MNISLIIAAAGNATRMQGSKSKVFLPLCGRPLISRTLDIFKDDEQIKEIIITANQQDMTEMRLIGEAYPKVTAICEGAATRALSVGEALKHVTSSSTHIAVHDAARPLLSQTDWQNLLAKAEASPCGAILAAPAINSIRCHENGYITDILQREALLLAETPQIFPKELLNRAYQDLPPQTVAAATDEAALISALGEKVAYVYSTAANMKVTFPEDMLLAEAIFAARLGEQLSPLRSGMGFDSHRLQAGRELVLGGINIPYDKGLLGHSDADVLTHAIIDACLGAAALGDIGRLFPDSDPAYKDIKSTILLTKTQQLLQSAGWQIVNIDATLIAEEPKLYPYNSEITACLAASLSIDISQISIKAKTNEGLGMIGNKEAMAALAIATIRKA